MCEQCRPLSDCFEASTGLFFQEYEFLRFSLTSCFDLFFFLHIPLSMCRCLSLNKQTICHQYIDYWNRLLFEKIRHEKT